MNPKGSILSHAPPSPRVTQALPVRLGVPDRPATPAQRRTRPPGLHAARPFTIALLAASACLAIGGYAARAESSDLKLSEGRQRIVDRYMNVLLDDPRNEFAFREVYGAFKAENKEFLLVNFFQNAIRLEPAKASLQIILGKLYVAFRDLVQADALFREAARLAPDDHYARYLLADVHFRQRRYPEAAQAFGAAAALATDLDDRTRSLHGLARVHASLADWPEARRTWEAIGQLRPYDVKALRKLAEAARDFQQADLADRWLRQLLDLSKEDSEGTCFVEIDLGDLAFSRDQFPDAVEHYRKARNILSESHWMVGELNARIRTCFERTRQLPSLQTDLLTRLDQDPRDVGTLMELAEFHAAAGEPRAAAERLHQATEASPRDVQILEQRRALLAQLNEDAAIEETSRRLLALSPQNVHYRLQDAEYLVHRGLKDNARAIWDEVIREDPKQPARYLAVARAMKRSGYLTWAEETFQKLIEVAPDIEACRIELAELLFQRAVEISRPEPSSRTEEPQTQDPATRLKQAEDDQRRARELIEAASQRAKLTLAETQQSGQLLLEHRQLEAAKSLLDRGRTRFPSDMGLARMLGETCLRLGATRPSASKDQNALYDQAIQHALAAYDLSPHPAIQRELNGELISLCLGYGSWGPDASPQRGGARGLTPLLQKHVDDYYSSPKNPMPAWCIADVQQQAPASHFSFTNIKNGPPKGLGFYTGDAERADAGLAFFSDSLQRDPLFIPGYLGKSVAYVLRDSFEQAVVELRKASVIDPINKWKYFLRIGDLFADQGQMEEACTFWNRVAERVFTDATVFYQLGARYFRAEKAQEAVSMLRKAIEANPNIPAYHMTLGNMYDYLRDYPSAVSEYRKALELSKQSMLLPVRQRLSEIQRHWAYGLFDAGEHARALEQFLEIRAFQEVLEKYCRAEKDERGLARLSPEIADVQIQVARCQEALGRSQEAEAIYETVGGQVPTAPIRMSPMRQVSLRHLLAVRKQAGGLKPDRLEPAGTVTPRPFSLRLVHHTRIDDITRDHSVTPQGVIYSGLARWVEVDPLSGRVLREMPPGKAIRTEWGVEVQVHRADNADRMRIIRDGRVADVNGLDGLRFDVARITITPQKVFALTEPAARLAAVDTATGQVAWNVQVAPSTLDFAVGDNHVAAIESHANRSAVVIRNRDSGATTLTRELPGEGIWLQPTPFGNKVFLAEDTAWQLHLLDTTTGDFAYVLTFHGTFPRPPTLHDGTLYLHVRAYKERTIYLYAIVPDTGQVLWKTDLQAMSVHSPPIFRGPDIVYLNPETYRIFLIDRQTGVRHAEASFEELMTKQQRDFLQFMRPFGDRLLLVGGRGDIHAFTVVPGGEPSR